MPVKIYAEPDPIAAQLWYIRLFEAQQVVIDAKWNARHVRSIFWRLYVNNRDGAGLKLGDRELALRKDRVYVIPAGVMFSCVNRVEVGHMFVHFDVVGLPPGVLEMLWTQPVVLGEQAVLGAMVRRLRKMLGRGGQADLAMRSEVTALVYVALAQVLREMPEAKRGLLDRTLYDRGPMLPAIRYMEEHLHEPIRNAELAAMCHLSEDHFIKCFRQSVGQTPGQYLLERRLTQAAQGLLFSRDKMEVIAERCGFGNRFYFTRVFTRRMGVSPGMYRAKPKV